MMTAQIAVKLRFFLLVACDTEIHLEIHPAQTVHRQHLTVTPEAVDLRNYVRLMPELYKIGNKVDADPGDWNFVVQMLLFFDNLGVHRNYIFMAKETFFDFRQSRMLRALDIRMAETAVDLFNAGVYPVAEIDRLDRSDVLSREKVVEVDKGEHKQNGCNEPPRPPPRFFSRRLGVFSHFLSVDDSRNYSNAYRASRTSRQVRRLLFGLERRSKFGVGNRQHRVSL
jgi:hypothetical protein